MSLDSQPQRVSERAFVALAVILPAVLACFHLQSGHGGDIAFFHRWYLAVRASASFYVDGPGINYPIVGVLLVSGPARVVDGLVGRPLELGEYWVVLKATLVVGEVLTIGAGERLARALGHAQPRALALGLYLLPSSWAGGAYFGQIDVWGTAFLLGAAYFAIRYRREGAGAPLGAALTMIVLAVLTKQLTWFACPSLALLVLDGLAHHRRPAHLGYVALAVLALLLPDPFLTLPEGEGSHLGFVLTHRSSHGDVVVASGASLWSLIARGGTPSSELVWFGITSQRWGWIAFGFSQLAVLVLLARDRRPLTFVYAAGLGELAMALLLTGVHERYLTHAIPLLVLAQGGKRSVASLLGLLVGVVSGLFVLSTFTEGLPWILGRPEPTALLTLAWASALVIELERSRRET